MSIQNQNTPSDNKYNFSDFSLEKWCFCHRTDENETKQHIPKYKTQYIERYPNKGSMISPRKVKNTDSPILF